MEQRFVLSSHIALCLKIASGKAIVFSHNLKSEFFFQIRISVHVVSWNDLPLLDDCFFCDIDTFALC